MTDLLDRQKPKACSHCGHPLRTNPSDFELDFEADFEQSNNLGRLARPTINLNKAVRSNRVYMKRLGWQPYFDRIVSILGFTHFTPDEQQFATAVATWQQQQQLTSDGMLGPRTWAKLRAALNLSPAPRPTPPSTAVQIPAGVCIPRGTPARRRIRALGRAVERTGTLPGFATFAEAVAHTESRWNNCAMRTTPGEARAACRLYRGASSRGFYQGNPFPAERWCFGSGGWFGFLPATGLSAGGATGPFAQADPYLVFDPVASIVMLASFVHRIRRRHGSRVDWLAVRRGMASSRFVADYGEQQEWSQGVRRRFTRALQAMDRPLSFMNQQVVVTDFPGVRYLLEHLRA